MKSVNLVRRKISPDGLCEIYKQQEEDVMHALYRCPALQALQTSTPAWNQGTLKQSTCFTDFIGFIFASTANLKLFTLSLWNLWNQRNNLQLGKPSIPFDKVLEHSQEWQIESHSNPLTSTRARNNQSATWSPPQNNWYKINFDGATFAEEKSAGIGVVIRNNKGHVIASLSQKIPLPTSAIKVDILATRRALELAMELGYDHIILEGDSEILHKALLVEGNNFTPYGHLVQDILFLSRFFSAFKSSLVRRSGNKLAYSLVRKSKSLNHMQIWMEDVPPDLLFVVQADLTSLP